MRYIGDVHAKFDEYVKLIDECDASIQVGDFGMGFAQPPLLGTQHRFIRGNHDNPALCAKHQNWINDATYENDRFFVGGARSVDRSHRHIGIDWWPDEEIAYDRFGDIIQFYETVKPKIVVSHDCPMDIARHLFRATIHDRSRTAVALQNMFEIHRPELWIFGHWHTDRRMTILGTEFICLAELSHVDL